MTTYGAVKATSASRAGSMARERTSARPEVLASNERRPASAEPQGDPQPRGELAGEVDGDAGGCGPACPEPVRHRGGRRSAFTT